MGFVPTESSLLRPVASLVALWRTDSMLPAYRKVARIGRRSGCQAIVPGYTVVGIAFPAR